MASRGPEGILTPSPEGMRAGLWFGAFCLAWAGSPVLNGVGAIVIGVPVGIGLTVVDHIPEIATASVAACLAIPTLIGYGVYKGCEYFSGNGENQAGVAAGQNQNVAAGNREVAGANTATQAVEVPEIEAQIVKLPIAAVQVIGEVINAEAVRDVVSNDVKEDQKKPTINSEIGEEVAAAVVQNNSKVSPEEEANFKAALGQVDASREQVAAAGVQNNSNVSPAELADIALEVPDVIVPSAPNSQVEPEGISVLQERSHKIAGF